MTTIEFYLLLYANADHYLAFLALSLAVYYFALRKLIWSIFDPLFLAYLSAAFAASVVLFLYGEGQISEAILFSFLATEIAFVFGFRLFKTPTPVVAKKVGHGLGLYDDPSLKVAFVLCLTIFTAGQLGMYMLHGIPALSESRLEHNYDTSAVGALLNKVVPVARILLLWFSLHLLFFRAELVYRLLARCALAGITVTYLLSGSKGGLVEMLFLLFVYQWWFKDSLPERTNQKIRRNLMRVLWISLALALAVVALRTDTAVGVELLFYLAGRFIQSGDTFIYAYPGDVWSFMPKSNFLAALFPGIFGNLFDVARSPPIGFQLAEYVNGFEMQEAPNTRHNLFGLMYFGMMAPVYSFLLGLTLRFFTRTLYGLLNKDCFTGALFVTMYLGIAGLETDANLALGSLTGSLSLVPAIIAASLIAGMLLGRAGERLSEIKRFASTSLKLRAPPARPLPPAF